MKDFYHGVMEFPIYRENPSMDDWVEMRVGSVLLTLRKRGAFPADGNLPSGCTAVQLAFRVTPQEIGKCCEQLREKKVKIWGPNDNDWGSWAHRNIFFKDPEGNLLEIFADIEFQKEK